MNASAIWRTTLERLETAPIDAVCKAWLQSSHLMNNSTIGADDIDAASLPTQDEVLYFTLSVPSNLARDVIITRWRRSIEDVLADVTGQPVVIAVTHGLEETPSPSTREFPNSRSVNNRFSTSMQHQTDDYAYYDFPTPGHERIDRIPARGASSSGGGGFPGRPPPRAPTHMTCKTWGTREMIPASEAPPRGAINLDPTVKWMIPIT